MKMFRVCTVGTADSSILISAASELEAACKYLMEHPSRADLSVSVPGGAAVVVKNADVIAAFPELAALVATAPALEAKAPAAAVPVEVPVSESGSAFDAEDANDYSKIGGWLWLVAIGLVASIIFQCITLSENLELLANPDLPEAETEYPGIILFIQMEAVCAAVLALMALVALPLFFMRKRVTRPLLIAFYLFALAYTVGDLIAGAAVLGDLMDAQSVADNAKSAIFSGIWAAYFIFSERAKKTFVR
jgi:hypothetical protein